MKVVILIFFKEYNYKSFCKGLEKPYNVNIIDSNDSNL